MPYFPPLWEREAAEEGYSEDVDREALVFWGSSVFS
jgi:hypothetical protein